MDGHTEPRRQRAENVDYYYNSLLNGTIFVRTDKRDTTPGKNG